jgi:hypothetical protein
MIAPRQHPTSRRVIRTNRRADPRTRFNLVDVVPLVASSSGILQNTGSDGDTDNDGGSRDADGQI